MQKPKKLVRPKKGRVFKGVCVGVGNYLNIDPVVVRAVWLLLLLPGGVPGIVPYLILWLITPEA